MSRILNSKLFSALLILLVFWLGNSLVNLNRQRENIDSETNSYEDKISKAEESNDKLAEFMKNIENLSFLEREAKIKYNYKLADEEVVFVYLDDQKSASVSFEEQLKSMPFWERWIIKIQNLKFKI